MSQYRLRAWLGWALAALAVLFAVQNLATVQVELLLWSLAMPRALLLVLLFAAGFAAGWLVHAGRGRGRRF
ncbi:MAG TPA: lipopolysaccharide assembly protein LapA domain-containing protein [Alphaproteobacteria bacterium]|nr:lipopolysaccharide assembly protein LapA domain-containing protein [Alphaproteobacteria bacterium]